MENLLIVFIKVGKFCRLLERNNISKDCIDLFNLNKGVAVKKDGTFDAWEFEESTESAICLFIPDDYPIDEGFAPKKPFKILYHNTIHIIQPELEEDQLYNGRLRSSEETGTPYDELAKAFRDNLAEIIKDIYEQVPYFDRELEEKLDLLSNCLLPKKIEGIKPISFLKKDFENFLSEVRKIKLSKDSEKIESTGAEIEAEETQLTVEQIGEIAWDNAKYIENLRNFRIEILGS